MIASALIALAITEIGPAQPCLALLDEAEASIAASDIDIDIATRAGQRTLDRQVKLGPTLLEARRMQCAWLEPLDAPDMFGFVARNGRTVRLTLGNDRYDINLGKRPDR